MPGPGGHRGEQAVAVEAGVVDENIESFVRRNNGPDRTCPCRGVGHVEFNQAAAVRVAFREHGGMVALAPHAEPDPRLRVVIQEIPAHRQAQPAISAGDQNRTHAAKWITGEVRSRAAEHGIPAGIAPFRILRRINGFSTGRCGCCR
jgi:hypothetical protein